MRNLALSFLPRNHQAKGLRAAEHYIHIGFPSDTTEGGRVLKPSSFLFTTQDRNIMLKVYQLIIAYSAYLYVFVDGKEVFMNFKGQKNNRGTFSTRDKKLQDAIEADSNYGKKFKLIYEEKPNVETTDTNEESAVELKEVTAKNLQGINDLVKELFPSYGKTFKSSEKAVAYFAENGYKLVIE